MGTMRRIGLVLASAAALLAGASTAQAANVVNGDFETGTLSGWTVNSTSASGTGYWFNYSGTVAPLTGAALSSTVSAPPQGTYAALADQVSPGRRILYLVVALDPVGPGESLKLSLFAYYKAQQGALSNPTPDSLDPTAPGSPNEQYRIDVMSPSAPLTSIDPADVLINVFRTRAGDPQSMAPTTLTADLTPYAGQTVRLRFAEVDNAGVLNASTDDVRIEKVSPDPTIQFSPPTRNRENGTATLPTAVNGAGTLELTGEGVATQTVQANAAGTFDMPVVPVNPLKAKVKKNRSGKANIVVKFTASSGKTVSDKRRVHLRNKRH
jgi:hypothetical protein